MIIKQFSDDGKEVKIIEINVDKKKNKWTPEYKKEYMRKYREEKKEVIKSYYQIHKLTGQYKYIPTGKPKGRPKKYLLSNNGYPNINTNIDNSDASN